MKNIDIIAKKYMTGDIEYVILDEEITFDAMYELEKNYQG